MSTYYIIMAKGFEYNDEIYNEQEGGTPLKVYKRAITAIKQCAELNLKEMSRIIKDEYGLSMYTWDNPYGDKATELLRKYGAKFTKDRYGDEVIHFDDRDMVAEAFEKMTPEEKVDFVESVNISFYEVATIKMEVKGNEAVAARK